jgi:hypothetical protein
VGLFRRSKPLHERLAEEGGLVERPTRPLFTGVIPETGIHGIAREREYDAVVSAEAPELEGNEASFVALPDGSLVVDEEQGDGDLTPLAQAVEQQVRPPYRALAVRKSEVTWAVAARRITVAEVEADGDEIELVRRGEERSLVLDGNRGFGTIPELEALADRDAVIRATRLDNDLWEIRVDPL